ncbi:single-stranded-DNA-specific exonuclease RecJ [Paenibacillus oenotherae]|uniref:Single-stranded-DNA-specific exonuclease RecJ n=1 Tax=Paenibacillus oenotherae TaxID=1435645 RepID=A0ABS7D8J5_9BACL|nr:single-stranded-DNA-specific exonuclease RecJ [Paenibacillus oenotherae]MBW7476253.1 single-stranded-DNA-specific exonuclease RecJ [Paenibacillus oenotherae]
MLQSRTRWMVAELDPEGMQRASLLAGKLSLPPLVAKLLVQRGFDEEEKARIFLQGGLECLHDPFLLKGMGAAVERIQLARERGEFVRIYGDYDADGVSSTTLMNFLFQRLGLKFDYYIPHRTLEGYGLNAGAIDKAADAGVTLLVTVDTGISAVEQIAHANARGIDVIVTDHHEPPHELPAALALINPKQHDCPYPFKGLAGVGVAFKLAEALLGEPPVEWTDIVALGTIADLMPLTDENRVLVRLGLDELRSTEKPGFRALAEVAGIELPVVTAANVAFGMAPRINAAGRLQHAEAAVRLLTESDEQGAQAAAQYLDTLNRERQRIVEETVQEAYGMWANRCKECAEAGRPEPSVIVLAGEGWNVGVVGIVASKLVERCYKPTLILGIDPETGMCKGSARSIEGYDLHAALTACEDLLLHYGGHQAAAGMSLHRDQLGELETRLGKLADEWLSSEQWVAKTAIDLACTIEDATLDVLNQLMQLEPFGIGNAAPRLLLQDAALADRRVIGKDSTHLKLTLSGEGKLLDAIGFGLGPLAHKLTDGAALELVGELSVNEWNGQRKAQFVVQDMRIGHVRLYDRRSQHESLSVIGQWLQKAAIEQGAILVPSDPWREAIEELPPTANWPKGIGIWTYDEFRESSRPCRELILIGRPPATDKLAAVIGCCQELEAVYALYDETGSAPGMHANSNSSNSSSFKRGVDAAEPLLTTDREQFGRLYGTLRRVCPIAEAGSAERLAVMLGYPVDGRSLAYMLQVFKELEFIESRDGQLVLVPMPIKKDLTHSASFREAQHRLESEAILFADAKQLTAWIGQQVESMPLSKNEGVSVS